MSEVRDNQGQPLQFDQQMPPISKQKDKGYAMQLKSESSKMVRRSIPKDITMRYSPNDHDTLNIVVVAEH